MRLRHGWFTPQSKWAHPTLGMQPGFRATRETSGLRAQFDIAPEAQERTLTLNPNHVFQVCDHTRNHSCGTACSGVCGVPVSAAPDPETSSSTTKAACWGRARIYSRGTRDTGGKATLRSFCHRMETYCTNFASSWSGRNRNGVEPMAPLSRLKGTYRVRS